MAKPSAWTVSKHETYDKLAGGSGVYWRVALNGNPMESFTTLRDAKMYMARRGAKAATQVPGDKALSMKSAVEMAAKETA